MAEEDASLDFVPFYALFVGFLLPPAGTSKTRHPAVGHQNSQFCSCSLRFLFLRSFFQTSLRLFFDLLAQTLDQLVNHRVIDRAAPLLSDLRSTFIGAGHRGGKSQLLFQRRPHLLVCFEAPLLSDRNAPRSISTILPLPNLQFNHPDDGAQVHRLFAPMSCLATAEGGKLRPGGQLPAVIFLPAVCESTLALRPILPFRYRARSAFAALSSSYCLLLVFLSLSCGSYVPTIMGVVSRCAHARWKTRPHLSQ